jgi:hypothetical protein
MLPVKLVSGIHLDHIRLRKPFKQRRFGWKYCCE